MPNYSSENISYPEYHAISELRKLHPHALEGKLRAVIVFGEMVATGKSVDINLLEVVEGWTGPRYVSFQSTEALPLRGRLRLYFLTPAEFEEPSEQPLPNETFSSADLLKEVRNAYAILRETPFDYAYDVMSRFENTPVILSPAAESQHANDDPKSFFVREGEKIA